ncbi:ABC transporter permease [Conexibacter woesei]|uniref:Binding-protein-dependent transport systems inner membrane component n=1 Tax=Conexibacter woesei (strain DSM 14684 / CCUG 47730 / CIP 108061 / JCM 11494 / NBRC 100937 / ID131577) TaxID=469383 RepID=D3F6Y7_CONWI|nr:ABC transporter permease [Conexibacter woesei]ADB52785.1 binding-protein-dependent transport systems inner membrane component [Conexibacter woesei DSM 14684]
MSATALSPAAVATAPRRRGAVLRALLRRPVAAASIVVIVLFVLFALAAPLLGDPSEQDFAAINQAPGGAYLLGADELGRDVLTRLAYGGRVSLLVGLGSTLLAFLFAVPLGLLAGYWRGWRDVVISRAVDVLLAFPYVIVAIALGAILGPSAPTIILALAIAQLPWIVRIVRGEVLSLREREFVAAAIVDGTRDSTIMLRYLLPNLAGVLVVQATLMIPLAIIGEALLSFLGVGVKPPTPTWGTMLSGAQPFVEQAPWLAIVPGATIAIVTFAFNLLGDSLLAELDPQGRR